MRAMNIHFASVSKKAQLSDTSSSSDESSNLEDPVPETQVTFLDRLVVICSYSSLTPKLVSLKVSFLMLFRTH